MRSRWFAGACAESNGLRVPGLPSRHCADLLIASEGVTLAAHDASAHLPWPSYPSLWSVTSVTSGRAGPIGVALEVRGEFEAATARLRRKISSPFTWLPRALDDGVVVPLHSETWHVHAPESDTLAALCTLLKERADLRERLAVSSAVQKLAADLADHPLTREWEHMGARRVTIEVLTALRAMGYRHHLLGRPVPCVGDAPDIAFLVDRVIERLAHSPYAKDLHVSPEEAAEIIEKHYLAIEPWPFHALTCWSYDSHT